MVMKRIPKEAIKEMHQIKKQYLELQMEISDTDAFRNMANLSKQKRIKGGLF